MDENASWEDIVGNTGFYTRGGGGGGGDVLEPASFPHPEKNIPPIELVLVIQLGKFK